MTPSAAADWPISNLHMYLLRIIEDHVVAIDATLNTSRATHTKETTLLETAIATSLSA
jgi:hypothetical protein